MFTSFWMISFSFGRTFNPYLDSQFHPLLLFSLLLLLLAEPSLLFATFILRFPAVQRPSFPLRWFLTGWICHGSGEISSDWLSRRLLRRSVPSASLLRRSMSLPCSSAIFSRNSRMVGIFAGCPIKTSSPSLRSMPDSILISHFGMRGLPFNRSG